VRRWIATRPLADPTRIGCAAARRPASTRRTITTTFDPASTRSDTVVAKMGRSRRRARTAGATATPSRSAAPATVSPRELRRTLGAYLAGAVILAILVILGTVTLAGALGPWIVLVADAGLSFALYRWAQARLADLPLSDEDRIMQTLAGGMLLIALAFALFAAVLLTIA
jgi:hypothetical protein